jgi:uncharacterized membrane protein
MLIAFPLGLLGTTVVFDLVFIFTQSLSFSLVAYWTLVAGLIGAAAAIPFGIIDYTAIPHRSRAKRIGLLHGVGNGIVSVCFLASWFLREPDASPSTLAMIFSFMGVALALITAWLGGELVSRLGIGVYEDAGPNASNSLRKKKDV